MFIYWVNLFSIPLWAIFFKIANIRSKKTILFILFLQLFLILSLRDFSVGSDTYAYIRIFENIKTYPFMDFNIGRYEKGYLLLNKLLINIENHHIFISVIGFIPLFLIFLFIYRYSKIPLLSVFLFISLGYFIGIFNVFRLMIAISLVTFSFKYIREDNLMKYLMCIIVAFLFHITAIIFLPVYFLRNIKINFKSITIYLIIAIFVYLSSVSISEFALNHFSEVSYDIESGGGWRYLLFLIIVMLVFLNFKSIVLKNDPKSLVLFHILFLAILTQILALDFGLMVRVTRYFSIYLIIIIPNMLSLIKKKYDYLFYNGVFLAISILIYSSLMLNNAYGVIPYQTFIK